MAEDDLLSGSVPDLTKKDTDLGIKEHAHRMDMQQSLFSSALAFAALLYMVAVAMGFIMLWMLNEKPSLHWHASILVGAFIIPPTIIVVGLMRALFKEQKSKDKEDDSTGVPIADICKEVMKKALDGLVKQEMGNKGPH